MSDFWEQKTPLQKTKFVLGLLLVVLIIVFSIANWQTTEFDLIFTRVQMPRTILILSCVIFGYILAAFMEGAYRQKMKKKQEEQNNDVSNTSSEE